MANPIKIIKGVTKAITTGKAKAALKASSVYDSKTAGLGLTKGSNRKTAKVIKKQIAKNPSAKAGLENRGARPTKTEEINRTREYQWNKLESRMDQMYDTRAGGPRAGEISGKPGKANTRKSDTVSRVARQKYPVKPRPLPIKKKAGNK